MSARVMRDYLDKAKVVEAFVRAPLLTFDGADLGPEAELFWSRLGTMLFRYDIQNVLESLLAKVYGVDNLEGAAIDALAAEISGMLPAPNYHCRADLWFEAWEPISD